MSQDKPVVTEGGCACGDVRYRVTGPANSVCNCHCHMCQKTAGASFVTWADFPSDHVEWLGESLRWHASSPEAERSFCSTCGSAVGFRFLGSDKVDVAVVLFDDSTAFPPTHDIFTESAQPWTVLDAKLPHYTREREED